jgi:hypothetical protein
MRNAAEYRQADAFPSAAAGTAQQVGVQQLRRSIALEFSAAVYCADVRQGMRLTAHCDEAFPLGRKGHTATSTRACPQSERLRTQTDPLQHKRNRKKPQSAWPAHCGWQFRVRFRDGGVLEAPGHSLQADVQALERGARPAPAARRIGLMHLCRGSNSLGPASRLGTERVCGCWWNVWWNFHG